MTENSSRRWAERRERLLVARVLEAGLEFNESSVEKIIGEMSYVVQKEKHPQDCMCYSSKPCHDNISDFNCFFCACPHYDLRRIDSVGFIGGCLIKSKKGKYLDNPNPGKDGFGEQIWDCAVCAPYHSSISSRIFLRSNLDHYVSLANEVKKECVEKGFSDFKSFADYLSEEVRSDDS